MSPRSHPNMIVIPHHLLEGLLRQAREQYPQECCSLLMGDVDENRVAIKEVVPAGNVTDLDPRRNYLIDWQTLLGALTRSSLTTDKVVGCFHSHPGGESRPSPSDTWTAWLGFVYLIGSVDRLGETHVTGWRVQGYSSHFEALTIRVVQGKRGESSFSQTEGINLAHSSRSAPEVLV